MKLDAPYCDFCDNLAKFQDGVYGPPSVHCCHLQDCINQAALTLWYESHEEVSE